MDLTGDDEMNEVETLQEMLGEPEKRQGERDARWRSVRNEHLRTHSFCIACGNTDSLEVHHIKPFVQNPELELDPDNLVTLCTCSSRGKMNCHLIMGHNGSMHEHNPNVVHDSVQMLKRINRSLYNSLLEKFRIQAGNSIRSRRQMLRSKKNESYKMPTDVAERLIVAGVPFGVADSTRRLASSVAYHAVQYADSARSLTSKLSSSLLGAFSDADMDDMVTLLAADPTIGSRLLRSDGSEMTSREQSVMIDVNRAIYADRPSGKSSIHKEVYYSLLKLPSETDSEIAPY